MSPFLKTDRLMLRPEEISDAARIAHFTGDYAVAQMIGGQSFPNFAASVEGRILINQARAPLGLEHMFAVDQPGQGLIGGAAAFLRGSEGIEIGYWLGRPYWGRGYGQEVAAAIRDFARALEVGPVFACYADDNPASARVLEKVGFVATGAIETRYSLARRAQVRCVMMQVPRGDRRQAA
ncbi:MAG: GNAT family N-acetyltransferase [Caulobacterales bacterium]